MLRYGMNIDHLVVIVKLGAVQADAVNFAFAYLVIIRIRPKSLFDRAERRLEFGVCHHPEGIQVAEIKSAAFFIPGAESAASEGEVGMKPAEGGLYRTAPSHEGRWNPVWPRGRTASVQECLRYGRG